MTANALDTLRLAFNRIGTIRYTEHTHDGASVA